MNRLSLIDSSCYCFAEAISGLSVFHVLVIISNTTYLSPLSSSPLCVSHPDMFVCLVPGRSQVHSDTPALGIREQNTPPRHRCHRNLCNTEIPGTLDIICDNSLILLSNIIQKQKTDCKWAYKVESEAFLMKLVFYSFYVNTRTQR